MKHARGSSVQQQPTVATTYSSALCQSCGAGQVRVFHEVRQVPSHSVLLLPDREAALSYPSGDIVLGVCERCGFISNLAFDARLNAYDGDYEATQGYSATFNRFHRRLAERLIERYQLHGKTVVEIGCGQGEFLHLLNEVGNCRGIGFDPAFSPARGGRSDNPQVRVIKDFYSAQYADVHGDLFCCKMTLEHIPDVQAFVSMVRQVIGERSNVPVFFQVPNARYVLQEVAFWDVYYEHCSYFTPGALARLFRACDFRVSDLWTDYDDQYVMIEAYPGTDNAEASQPAEESVADVLQWVDDFSRGYAQQLTPWRALLDDIRREALRTVIWGGGSKGVTFLNTLGIGEEIPYAVDINPHKHGTYIAGSGQEIVGPEFLRSYRPDLVIVMNPMYREEIGRELRAMDISARMVAV